MTAIKLTAKSIASITLPPGESELVVHDTEIPGFYLRIREGGSRTLGYRYRFGKLNRKISLGTAVKEAFPDVRQRVLDLQAKVRLGTDPAAVKETAKKEAGVTFKVVAERYLAKQAKSRRPKTIEANNHYLLVKAKTLHTKPIASIIRRDIAELLTNTAANVSKGSGDVTANRLRATLSAMFTWAAKEGLIENNPASFTYKREETPRKRTLVDPKTKDISELVEVWQACQDDTFGRIVQLLCLTGQRRDEIGGLRWSEMDERLTRIVLPERRTKNKQEHTVPLAEAARDIIGRCHKVLGRDTLFSGAQRGFSDWHGPKQELDSRISEARTKARKPPMERWTLHDIRRSVATGLGNLNVPPHVVEAALNHITGTKAGVAGTYNKSKYEAEVAQALILWAEHLMATVNGKSAKIVPLRA